MAKKDSEMIPQHKRMAMGHMPKATGNSGMTGFEKHGDAKQGKVRKSGTSTGGGYKK